jgi:transposase
LFNVEHLSKRAIARRLGVHRNTVTQALAAEALPTYQRVPRPSLLDPHNFKIHALLGEDPQLTRVCIYEILQAEGYPGRISILRDFLREVRPQYRQPPVCLRMSYPPGVYGQVDWGTMPAPVRWQDQLCPVHAFVMVLCHSRLLYVEFSLGMQLADFLRCHQNALRFFGGAPRSASTIT